MNWLRRTFARLRDGYMTVGRGIGGLLGIVAFLATWMFLIARFGLMFGVALGWIPAAIVAMLVSVLLNMLWGPLVLLLLVVLTAPSWDKSGVVHRNTVRAATATAHAWQVTEAAIRKAAIWTRDEARREGLL